MIEFAPTLGEDALIGRAPVRPRGRSSSSSINHHSISSKQQRSSSITNSPDPSIITSDAAEPTAAGSRGAPATRRRLSVPRRPFRGTCHVREGIPERAAPIYLEQHNLESLTIYAARDGRPWLLCGLPLGGYAQKKGATTRSNAVGARALYSPLSPPHLPTPGRLFGHGGNIDREVHRGPPPGASGEGGSSLHGPISAMHRTQRAPFDEKHAHQRRP